MDKFNISYTIWADDKETEMREARDVTDVDAWVDTMCRVPGVGFAIYKIEETGDEE